jgi:hypothetical protein
MFLSSISSSSDGQLTRFQQIPCWTEISSLSDEELFALYDRCELKFPQPSKTKFTSVRRIASDVVMKGDIVMESEPLTMNLVRESTTIPVPAVRRFLEVDRRKGFVMDYIPGKTVGECWSRLGLFQRARLFWNVRRYIRQLRRVLVPGITRSEQFPGPIGREPQMCYGPMFSCDWVSSSRLHCIQVLCSS